MSNASTTLPPSKTCSIYQCNKEAKASRGWCWTHYGRWRRYGDPHQTFQQKLCSVEDCNSNSRAGGMCGMHYERQRVHGDPNIRLTTPWGPCETHGCEERSTSRGLCSKHYYPVWIDAGGRSKKAAASAARRVRVMKAGKVDSSLNWKTLRESDPHCYLCGEVTDPLDYYQEMNRGGWMQTICGHAYPTLDHIIPVSKGGDHTADNVALACSRCNKRKHAKTDYEHPATVDQAVPDTEHAPTFK